MDARTTEDELLVLAATGALAAVWTDLGREQAARALVGPALDRARILDRPELEAALGNELARTLEDEDLPAAAHAYRAAAAAAARSGDRVGERRVLANAIHAAAAAGEEDLFFELETRLEPEQSGSASAPFDSMTELRIGRAQLLMLAAMDANGVGRNSSAAAALSERARRQLEGSLTWATRQDDDRTESHALGYLAGWMSRAGRSAEARSLGWRALRAAQRLEDEELEAHWYAQLARLAASLGDREAAIIEFEAAAERLTRLRPTLERSGRTAARTHLLDRLDAHLYLELVDLLLRRATQANDPEAEQLDLRRAQAVLEALKAVELRDYFQDDCVDAYRAKIADPGSVSASAVILYPVALDDRLALLASHRGVIRQFVVPVTREEFDGEVRELRRWIVNRTRNRYRRPARRLYDWIVRPIESWLEEIEVDTLVFVPGGSLRTVPMAALSDGERFLVERYAIATIPGLELTDPKPLDRESAEVFLAGISKARDGFSALPGVPEELAAVQRAYGGTLLLDEDFERQAVIDAFEGRRYNIVHFATHAQFGSGAEDSFLLAWDGRLGLDALADVIGVFRYRDTPLELLLLSACETAEGDDRAALGLAGVAVKAGARSALATLWSIDDQVSSRIVIEFYRALAEPGTTRAQALQRAQRKMLADPSLRHPALWAPFLMISNWL